MPGGIICLLEPRVPALTSPANQAEESRSANAPATRRISNWKSCKIVVFAMFGSRWPKSSAACYTSSVFSRPTQAGPWARA